MSGCDLPDDPEMFKLWQDFQADSSKKRNKELNRFADPEDCTGFLGRAFKLKLEEEEEILSALKGEPVTLINRAALSKEKAQ